MIDPALFAAFVAAAAILILMPGPIVTLVVANALSFVDRAPDSPRWRARASATRPWSRPARSG